MEEQYLRDIRALAVLKLAHAISLDPANAVMEGDRETVTREGSGAHRVRFDAALDQAIAKFKQYRPYIDAKLDA